MSILNDIQSIFFVLAIIASLIGIKITRDLFQNKEQSIRKCKIGIVTSGFVTVCYLFSMIIASSILKFIWYTAFFVMFAWITSKYIKEYRKMEKLQLVESFCDKP